MLYPIRRHETWYNIFQPIPCVLNRFTRFLTQFYYTFFLPSWYTCSRCNYCGHCPLLFNLCQRRVVVLKPDLLSQPWIFWTCHQHPDTTNKVYFERRTRLHLTGNPTSNSLKRILCSGLVFSGHSISTRTPPAKYVSNDEPGCAPRGTSS